MNFYEELGVARSASLMEIQQAYKALVRIVHPDQQRDERLRRLSELQLTRLNHVADVLTDPGKRTEYDLGLDRLLNKVDPRDMRTAHSRVNIPLRSGMLVWGLIGLILTVSLVFWMREPPAAYSQSIKAETGIVPEHPIHVPAAQPDPASLIRPAPPSPRRREISSLDVVPGLAYQPFALKVAPPAPPPPVPIPEEITKPTETAAPPGNLPQPNKAITGLRGRWLYANRQDDSGPGFYPPQYIEMQVSYRDGFLRGKYFAKYRVTDRALSSEVSFQFAGKANEATAVLPWSGAQGSRGEVRIKPLSSDSLEVTWITTAFGRDDVLASGKAVLYRSDGP